MPRLSDVGHYAITNGLRMYYEVHGEGEPLLLLHGGTATTESLVHQIPVFAREFRVIAPEQMGHGRTADAADRGFHYHDMAEDTVALLDHLAIARASIVGWSDGGILGVDIAINHPERVRRLAFSGMNFRVDGMERAELERVRLAKPTDWPLVFREAYDRLSPDGPAHWPAMFSRIVKMFLSEPNYTNEQMASIEAPTLVVIGDKDIVRPEHAVETFRLVPNAQLCVVPDAGHGVPAEKAEFWNEIVLGFLRQQ